jgi:hypothetical protein
MRLGLLAVMLACMLFGATVSARAVPCSPPQAPVGSIGCQPPLPTPPQSTDLMPAWRSSLFPNSLGTYTMGQLATFFQGAGGFATLAANIFTGTQTFAHATAGFPSIVIPTKVATPTSPVDGAIWNDGLELVFQVASVSKPLLAIPEVDGLCAVGAAGAWTTGTCGSGGTVAWPSPASLVVSNGSNTPDGLAPVNGDCVLAIGGAWTAGGCGGLATIEIKDSFGHTITDASTLFLGPGLLVSGSTPTGIVNQNQPDRLVTSSSGTPPPTTITALDLGGQVNFNGASLTMFLPAITSATPTGSATTTALTLSSGAGVEVGALVTDTAGKYAPGTIIVSGSGTAWVTNNAPSSPISSATLLISFGGAGQGITITNRNSTPLVISCGGGAINIYPGGCSGSIPPQGGMACLSNGSTWDCPGLAAQPNQAFLNQDQTWTGTQTWASAIRSPNVQTATTYTLAATDCGGVVQTTNAAGVVITLPGSLTISGSGVGCTVMIDQEGAGQVTVVTDGTATLTTAINSGTAIHTRAQHSVIVEQVTANVLSALNWNLFGDGS